VVGLQEALVIGAGAIGFLLLQVVAGYCKAIGTDLWHTSKHRARVDQRARRLKKKQ
jgi:threonine dehydrogenase-like Zn-dependent dehydrogenase